jgi:hypothetical protein
VDERENERCAYAVRDDTWQSGDRSGRGPDLGGEESEKARGTREAASMRSGSPKARASASRSNRDEKLVDEDETELGR